MILKWSLSLLGRGIAVALLEGKGGGVLDVEQPFMNEKILIADDEEAIRLTFAEFLHDAGYRVATVNTLSKCIEKMQDETFDLLFLDIMFGNENGLDAIRSIKEMQPNCKIVVITGNPQPRSLVTAKMEGAIDFLTKPVRQASLLYNVKKVLSIKELPVADSLQ